MSDESTPEIRDNPDASRYEVLVGGQVAVARAFFGGEAPVVAVATGATFPDALAAGAHVAAGGGPLLLSARGLPDGVRRYVREAAPDAAYVYGGPLVVSESVRIALNETR